MTGRGGPNCGMQGTKCGMGAARSLFRAEALYAWCQTRVPSLEGDPAPDVIADLQGDYVLPGQHVRSDSLALAMLEVARWDGPLSGCVAAHDLEVTPAVAESFAECFQQLQAEEKMGVLVGRFASIYEAAHANTSGCAEGRDVMAACSALTAVVHGKINRAARVRTRDTAAAQSVPERYWPGGEDTDLDTATAGWRRGVHDHLLVWERLLLGRENKYRQGRGLPILVYYAGCHFACSDVLPPPAELILSQTPALDYGIWSNAMMSAAEDDYGSEIVADVMTTAAALPRDDRGVQMLAKWLNMAAYQDCMLASRARLGTRVKNAPLLLGTGTDHTGIMLMRGLDAMGWAFGSEEGRLWLDPEEIEYQVLNYYPHDVLDVWRDYMDGESHNAWRMHYGGGDVAEMYAESLAVAHVNLSSCEMSHRAARRGDPRAGVGLATGLFTVVNCQLRHLFKNMLAMAALTTPEERREWTGAFVTGAQTPHPTTYSEHLGGPVYTWTATGRPRWPAGLFEVIEAALGGDQQRTWWPVHVDSRACHVLQDLLVGNLARLMMSAGEGELRDAARTMDAEVDAAVGALGEELEGIEGEHARLGVMKNALLCIGAWSLGVPVLMNLATLGLLARERSEVYSTAAAVCEAIRLVDTGLGPGQ